MAEEKEITPEYFRKYYKVKSRTTWAQWIRPLVEKKLVRAHAKKYQPNEIAAIFNLFGRK